MVIGTVNSSTMDFNYEDSMCILQFGQTQVDILSYRQMLKVQQ